MLQLQKTNAPIAEYIFYLYKTFSHKFLFFCLTLKRPPVQGRLFFLPNIEEKKVYFENANMTLCTLLSFFVHTFVIYSLSPPPPVLTPFQLSPSSNSFSSGLILMWLPSLSSHSSPFFLLSFSLALSLSLLFEESAPNETK